VLILGGSVGVLLLGSQDKFDRMTAFLSRRYRQG
jgi:hypothetical protein